MGRNPTPGTRYHTSLVKDKCNTSNACRIPSPIPSNKGVVQARTGRDKVGSVGVQVGGWVGGREGTWGGGRGGTWVGRVKWLGG